MELHEGSLPSTHQALALIPALHKLGMLVHVYNNRTWRDGGSRGRGSRLHIEFYASQGNMQPWPKETLVTTLFPQMVRHPFLHHSKRTYTF